MEKLTVELLRRLHESLIQLGQSSTPSDRFDACRAEQAVNAVETAQRTPVATVSELARLVGTTIAEVMRAPIIASGNDRLALCAAKVVAEIFTFDLALEYDDPHCRHVLEEAAQRGSLASTTQSFIVDRLRKRKKSRPVVTQLELPGLADAPESTLPLAPLHENGVTAYVVTALTNATADQLAQIEADSASVAEVLAHSEINVHQPTLHTHPRDHSDKPDFQVQALDYSRVVNADLLVVLADVPSFGGGMELAWASGVRAQVVVLVSDATKVSKLITAGTGNLHIVRYTSAKGLKAALTEWLDQHQHLLDVHRHLRLERESAYSDEWLDIRERVLNAGVDEDAAQAVSLSITRIQEIIKSPSHYASATRDELAGIDAYVSVTARKASMPVEPSELLSHRESVALDDAAIVYGWSPEDVRDLREHALNLKQTAGIRRLTLSNPVDWKKFRDQVDRRGF